MKSIFASAVVLVIMVSLCSCGNTNDLPADSNTEHTSSTDAIIDTPKPNEEEAYSDLEIVAAKFCMAYMNHLKNPYSFNVKSIWAYSSSDGSSHVYVKFTAENSFGAESVSEITNTIPITDSVIASIADTDSIMSSLSIYITEGQNERNDGTRGEWFEAEKIQTYINDNYR